MRHDRAVYAFPEYLPPSERLATVAGLPLEVVDVHRFPDGESRVRLSIPVPRHVVFCRSLDMPNDKLIELLLASEAARDLGAERLTLVAPYLCYMRQDKAFVPGEAVSQRVIGGLLARVFDEILTVDPHLHRIGSLEEAIPGRRAVSVTAAHPMGEYIARHVEAPMIVGPDKESQQWVRRIADPFGFDFAVGVKARRGDRHVSIDLPDVELGGRNVVIVDDVASTGSTLAAAASQIREREPREITVFVVHPLFVGDACETLVDAGVRRVWSTDTIMHDTNVVQMAGALAESVIGWVPGQTE